MRQHKSLTVFCSVLALCLLVAGCKTTHDIVEVPVYVHDTVNTYHNIYDSIYIDKWHTVYVNGDTVRLADSVVLYRYKTRTDTIYKYIEKPVEVIKEVIKEVEKPLAGWKRLLMWLGVAGIVCFVCVLILKIPK